MLTLTLFSCNKENITERTDLVDVWKPKHVTIHTPDLLDEQKTILELYLKSFVEVNLQENDYMRFTYEKEIRRGSWARTSDSNFNIQLFLSDNPFNQNAEMYIKNGHLFLVFEDFYYNFDKSVGEIYVKDLKFELVRR
jgi:hypothetical protein